MPTYKRCLLAALLLLACGAANAHPFHNLEPITESTAPRLANQVVAYLVDIQKLPGSWMYREFKSVSTRNTPGGLVWVVVFQNPNETDATRTTLFIFLDELGNPINANFSGEMK